MKKRPHIMSVLVVVLMVAAAGYASQKEIIFPEVAALAFGAWVMEETPWKGAKLNIWLSPTLAALSGFLIVRFLPYSPYLMIAGAFVLVVLQLSLLRSSVLPSISAATLPILLNCNSWYYPLSVGVLTGIIAAGHFLAERFGRGGHGGGPCGQDCLTGATMAYRLIHYGKLFAVIIIVAAVALKSHWIFMIAPPLIVSFAELSKPDCPMREKPFKVFLLLSLAAFSGVVWLYLIFYVMHWPMWISAGLSVLSVFFFYYILNLQFPPAAAIALLPVIIPARSLWVYPWSVLLGSFIFVSISAIWFVRQRTVQDDIDSA
ncbi:MAG: HPP family protein [Actinomycetota bacterium]|nr:HPP family protein [Actinomycetota bacterium]